jgi:alpha-N-arabinofuranosidase
MAGLIRTTMEAPKLAPHPWAASPTRDEFDQPTLGLAWNFLGNPTEGSWSLSEQPGSLCLYGSVATLDDGPPICFVGRRQQHVACEAATLLDAALTEDGQHAGVSVWMNPRHHYDLFAEMVDGVRTIAVRRRIGDLYAIVARNLLPPGPVLLHVQATKERYTFAYTAAGGELQRLATGETRYLATEVAGGFTGVYLAMFASGVGARACFEWFEYRA